VSTPPPKVTPLIVPRASAPRPRSAPIGLIVAALVVLVLIGWVAFTARPGDSGLYPGAGGQPKTTIYLVENGFHSNLAIPRAALFAKSHPIALATAVATDKPWVMIGWGDARFYTQQGFSPGRLFSGLRALLLPGNRSVVHIEGIGDSPDHLFSGGVHPILVTDAGLERILSRVDQSLALDAGSQPQRSQTPRLADEAFFRSVEHFSLVHLCNHWTAELLNAAGLPITPVIDTLPAGLGLDLRARAGVK
jgi:uncharacterized protein (TIGR02117 family)